MFSSSLAGKAWAPSTVSRPSSFSFWQGVGQVSGLPVNGVSDSARGQRPPQPADQEVCPTWHTIMGMAGRAPLTVASRRLWD